MTDLSRLQCKMKYINSLYRTMYVLKIFNAGRLIILVYSCILNCLNYLKNTKREELLFQALCVCGGGW